MATPVVINARDDFSKIETAILATVNADNWLSTTITTALANAATKVSSTLTVDSTASFESAGTIRIGDERMTYAGKTATTFTGVTRAARHTTAATHAVDDTVTLFNLANTVQKLHFDLDNFNDDEYPLLMVESIGAPPDERETFGSWMLNFDAVLMIISKDNEYAVAKSECASITAELRSCMRRQALTTSTSNPVSGRLDTFITQGDIFVGETIFSNPYEIFDGVHHFSVSDTAIVVQIQAYD